MSLVPGRQFNKMADGMGPQPRPQSPSAPSPTPTPFKKLPDIPKQQPRVGTAIGGGFTQAGGSGFPGSIGMGSAFGPSMT